MRCILQGRARAILPSLVAVMSCAASSASHALEQQTWTVQAAVAKAKELSPRLQQARASQTEADWKRVEALSGFLPKLNVTGTRFFDQRFVLTNIAFGGTPLELPQIAPTTIFTLSASIPVFDGLQNFRRLEAARANGRAAAREADWTEFRLEQDIRLKFYQNLAAERMAEVSDQNLKTLEDHLAKTHLLRRGGVATEFDVLRTEAQLSEAQSDRLLAYDNVAIANRALAEAVGIETSAELSPDVLAFGHLTGELPLPKPELVKNARFAQAAMGRLDVVAAHDRAEAADSMRKGMVAHWAPRIDLVGSYAWYNNLDGSWDSGRFRSANQFGVQMTWNLFDGMASLARQREAAAQSLQAEKAARIAELRMPNEFDLWKRKYFYASALHAAKVAMLQKSKEAVRLAQEGLRAGARTNSEVLDAQLDLFRSRAGMVSSSLSSLEALIGLELAIGRKIADDRNL